MSRARLAWLGLALVVVVTIGLALSGDDGGTPSIDKQVDSIGRTVRCPTCRGQSVSESAAPAAQAIKTDIRERLEDGQSRQQIQDYLEGRYGEDILLTPPSSGVGGLVWIIPVVVGVAAVGGLVLALQRWSGRSLAHASDADKAMVERNL